MFIQHQPQSGLLAAGNPASNAKRIRRNALRSCLHWRRSACESPPAELKRRNSTLTSPLQSPIGDSVWLIFQGREFMKILRLIRLGSRVRGYPARVGRAEAPMRHVATDPRILSLASSRKRHCPAPRLGVARRRFVWNPTLKMARRSRARYACGQAAFEPAGLYAVSCGTQQSHQQPPAATLAPALPASGKGASRPLPSGVTDRKVMADHPLTSLAGQTVGSRPSHSGALRAALTRLSDPRNLGSGRCCVPHETMRGHRS